MPATSARVATLFLVGAADLLSLASAWLGASGEWDAATALLPVAVTLTVIACVGLEMLTSGAPS